MRQNERGGALYFGILADGLPSKGLAARRAISAQTSDEEAALLSEVVERVRAGREQTFAHRPRAGRRRLNLALDRPLMRWRDKAGAPVW